MPIRSKSKRKSAQNDELRLRESNSEDDDEFLMKRIYCKTEIKSTPTVKSVPTVKLATSNMTD